MAQDFTTTNSRLLPMRYFPASIVFLLATAASLVLALLAYLSPESGVADSGGSLLSVLSCSALCLVALVRLFRVRLRNWQYSGLVILTFLGIAGTALAAYFLDLPLLILGMVIAAIAIACDAMIRGISINEPKANGERS